MPTYQYRCATCGHDLEVVQKFTDASLTECPQCHGELRKVFNAVGVVFKGSGFYKTDNRSSSSGSGSSDSSSSKSTSSGSSSSGSTSSGPSASGESSTSSSAGASTSGGSSTSTPAA